MENPINIDDFGGKTTILGNIFFRRSEGGIFSISLRQVTAFSKVLIKAFFAISSACDGPTAGSVPVPPNKAVVFTNETSCWDAPNGGEPYNGGVSPTNPWVFPTKNDHFGVFWGYHHLRKHPNEIPSRGN